MTFSISQRGKEYLETARTLNPEPGGGRVRAERLTASQIGAVALVTAME